jgi:hypothetical protein
VLLERGTTGLSLQNMYADALSQVLSRLTELRLLRPWLHVLLLHNMTLRLGDCIYSQRDAAPEEKSGPYGKIGLVDVGGWANAFVVGFSFFAF